MTAVFGGKNSESMSRFSVWKSRQSAHVYVNAPVAENDTHPWIEVNSRTQQYGKVKRRKNEFENASKTIYHVRTFDDEEETYL